MKLNDQVIVHKLGENMVAYDNNNSMLHELNEVGFLILESIEAKNSKKQILDLLVKEYDISKNQATNDLENYLSLLEKKDLITR